MRATITYTGGKSYWIGHTRFKLNIPKPVTDPGVIAHCQRTSGFSVSVEAEKEPPKKIREVVKTRAAVETEEAPPKRSTRGGKKSSSRRS